jgi:hypothetical protein
MKRIKFQFLYFVPNKKKLQKKTIILSGANFRELREQADIVFYEKIGNIDFKFEGINYTDIT